MLLYELRHQVVLHSLKMLEMGLVHLTSGNVSARDPQSGLIAITPTSLPYDVMTTDDVCVVDLEGNVVEGHRKPTSEMAVHLAIYRRRPDIQAIVHTHSTAATTLSIMKQELPLVIINLFTVGGAVPVAPYVTPGTRDLGEMAAEVMGDRNAVLLQNHGVFSCSPTLGEALGQATYIEEGARMFLAAKAAGGPVTSLPEGEVDRILDVYHLPKTRR